MDERNSLDHLLRKLEPTPRWLSSITEQGGEVIAVGAFQALMHPGPGGLGLNYAAPIEPLGPASEVVDALRCLRPCFAERKRAARIEFNEPLFPNLSSILEQEGFILEEREPLLILSPDTFRSLSSPDVQVKFLDSGDIADDLESYQAIFTSMLLERDWKRTDEKIDQFRKEIALGANQCHALATLRGEAVGTGYISSLDGICEITRVATVPVARRRGVAATLTSFILQHRFRQGDELAWLTASGEAAQKLYQKLGFRLVGDRLYYRLGDEA